MFLLTFILHIIIGQNDIKIALPIVSLSSFIIFFIIAINNYALRGSIIFKAGMFLICCDSICLIMIQTKNTLISINNPVITFILLLTPALARMCLPMFLPFIKQLYNACEEEACMIIVFLQILGFFLLMLICNEIIFSFGLSLVVITLILLGVIYLFVLILQEKNTEFINYYLFLFYSSFSVALLFISKNNIYIKLSIMLFVCNTFSYIISFYIHKKSKYFSNLNFLDTITKFSYIQLLGIPAFGVGFSLWMIIWQLLSYNESKIIIYILVLFLCFYFLFSFTAAFNNLNYQKKYLQSNTTDSIFYNKNNYILLFFIGLILNIIFPLIINYKFRG